MMIPRTRAFLILLAILLFSVNLLQSQDRHWVGGTGNWSDSAHWAAVAGGMGGFSVPDSLTNVFFTNTSFTAPGQVVTIDVDAYCRNMRWTNTTNTPVLAGVSTLSITLKGSLVFSANMDHQFQGDYWMTSMNNGLDIEPNGHQFHGNMTFFNVDGNWTLQSDLVVAGTIEILSGTFNSGNEGNLIRAGGFISSSNFPRFIDLRTSIVQIDQGSNVLPATFLIGGTMLDLQADETVIQMSGSEAEFILSGDTPFEFNELTTTAELTTLNSVADNPPIFSLIEFHEDGQIFGDHVMSILRLTRGQTYFIENGSTQTMEDLQTINGCDGNVNFANIFTQLQSKDLATFVFTIAPFVWQIEHIYLRNIRAIDNDLGLPVRLFRSFDGGNNPGWEFDQAPSGRELVWVGGAGDWNDPAHWMDLETNENPTCIPTHLDNVLFDDNSLSAGDQVTGSESAFCNDFLFSTSGYTGFFDLPKIFISNDLFLYEPVDWRIEEVWLVGNDEEGGTVLSDRQLVETGTNTLINLSTFSERNVVLVDGLDLTGTLEISGCGRFTSDGQNINAQIIRAQNAPVEVNMAGSTVTIFGDRNGLQMPMTFTNVSIISMSNTVFELTSAMSGFLANVGPLGSVHFTNPDGTGIARSTGSVALQRLEFENNGQVIEQTFTIDSLIFSPGKTYQITGDPDLVVNEYLESLGEICLPIRFESILPGTRAGLSMPSSSNIAMQYTEIRDLGASGGANFMAGFGSFDAGNNSGWIFPMDSEDNITTQYLGLDRSLCNDTTLVLQPFDQDEITSITWMDGSSELSFMVPPEGGMITAQVLFPNSCTVADTVIIQFDEAFEIDLGQDTSLCEGEMLNLDVTVDSATYAWQHNFDQSQFTVVQPGQYGVTVERGACSRTDEINVNYITINPINLGPDTTLCEGESILLSATDQTGLTFQWQDGTPESELSVSADGEYWVLATDEQCSASDTINISFDPLPILELGMDTTLCEGEDIVLNSGLDSGNFLWNTGSTAPSIPVDQAGDYSIDVTRGACEVSDQVTVNYVIIEQFDIGVDTSLCEGDTLQLTSPVIIGDFQWSDGTQLTELDVSTQGLIWLEVTEGRCAQRDSILVNFDPLPVVQLGPDTTLCEGEDLFLDTGLDSGSFMWNTGSTAPGIPVIQAGTYQVEVERGACLVEDEIEVEYVLISEFDLGQDTILCSGDTLTLDAGGVGGAYLWNTGSQNNDLVVSQAGIYWLEVSADRCSARDTVQVLTHIRPIYDLGQDTSICTGQSLVLEVDLPYATTWNNGSTTDTLLIDQTGTYFVNVVNGVCNISDTIDIEVIDLDSFDLGENDILCEGEIVDLEAPNVTGVNLLWNDGSDSTFLRVRESGQYWLEISRDLCTSSDTISLSFDPALDFDIGPSDTLLCPGDLLVLSTGIDDGDHFWVGGSDSSSFVVSESGTYGVFVIRGECMEQQTLDVDYVVFQDVNLGPDTTICQGESLTLNPQTGPDAMISWIGFPDTSALTVQNAGSYIVEVGIDRCNTFDTIEVFVQSTPLLALGSDTTICEGEVITLEAGISGESFLWSTSEISSSITVANPGTYILTLTDAFCTVMDSINIAVQALPEVDLGSDILACEGESIVLDAFVEDAEYLWQDNALSFQYVVTNQGLYSVSVSLFGCMENDTVQVAFNPIPETNLGEDLSICSGENTSIGVTDLGLTYLWNTGASTSQILVDVEDTYILSVTDNSDASCSATDTIFLETRPLPIFDLGDTSTVCEGEELTLSINHSFDTYLWNTGDQGTSISTGTAGTYWLESSLNACTFRDSVDVAVQAFPIVNLGLDTVICEGTSLTLSAGVSGASYLWSDGSTSPDLEVSQGGSYTVIVDINNCQSSDDLTVDIKASPIFSLGGSSTICEGESIDLSVPNPSWEITWNTGESGQSITIDAAGTYTASALDNGCTFEDSYQLTTEALPQFDLGQDFSKCEELVATLTVERSDVEVVWQDGTMGPNLIASDPGLYVATAMTDLGCIYEDEIFVSNRECLSFTMYVPNAFSPNNDGQNDLFDIGFPREVLLHSYTMSVFDRWGNRVFVSNDPNFSWDGRFDGNELRPGVYVYSVEVRFSDDFVQDQEEVIQGSVTLVR